MTLEWYEDTGTAAATHAPQTYRQWPAQPWSDEPTGWRMGWQCPLCKRVNAPFIEQCPCAAGVALNTNGTSSAPFLFSIEYQSPTDSGQPTQE